MTVDMFIEILFYVLGIGVIMAIIVNIIMIIVVLRSIIKKKKINRKFL